MILSLVTVPLGLGVGCRVGWMCMGREDASRSLPLLYRTPWPAERRLSPRPGIQSSLTRTDHVTALSLISSPGEEVG